MQVSSAFRVCILSAVLASCASPKVGQTCPPPSLGPAPEELQTLFRQGGFKNVLPAVWAKLDSSVGAEFPDFQMTAPDGSRVHSSDLIHGPTAFVLLPPNAEIARNWRAGFAKNGWKTPSGRAVVILRRTDQSELVVPRGPRVYVVEPPLPGYLGYAIVTPTALLVSADRHFEGYGGNFEKL